MTDAVLLVSIVRTGTPRYIQVDSTGKSLMELIIDMDATETEPIGRTIVPMLEFPDCRISYEHSALYAEGSLCTYVDDELVQRSVGTADASDHRRNRVDGWRGNQYG